MQTTQFSKRVDLFLPSRIAQAKSNIRSPRQGERRCQFSAIVSAQPRRRRTSRETSLRAPYPQNRRRCSQCRRAGSNGRAGKVISPAIVMNDIVLSARACIRRKRDLVEPAAIDLRFWAGNNNKTTFNLTTITFVMFIVAMPPLSPGGPTQFAFPVLLCLGASCPPGWRPSLYRPRDIHLYRPQFFSKG